MDKIKRHAELSVQNHKTYIKKNNDYGDSFSRMYQELGIVSAVTRIGDKYNRLVNLAKGAKAEVKDESIIDTLMDMANYCLMTVMEIENENK